MRLMAGLIAAALAFALGLHGTASASTGTPAATLSGASIRDLAGHSVRSAAAVGRFYRERDFQPIWTGRDRSALRDLQAAVDAAAAHGLSPSDYHASALAKAFEDGEWTAVEILATDAYLTLGAHLLRGKVDPVSVEPNWTASRRSADLIAHLVEAVENGRVRESLEALAPGAPSYKALQAALPRYEGITAAGGWPEVPDGPTLKPGMQGTRVAVLRRRLAAEGLLAQPTDGPDDVFDAATEAAVGTFQRRIGLEADGVAGPLTLRELNRSAAGRAAQIRANLERWRWLAEDLGDRHVRVNIADFRLETWTAGKPENVYDVIVGRTYRKTPVFSDRISFVVLNPWWETPPNIARLDKLPAFKSDPGAIQKLGFEVLDRGGNRLDATTIDWQAYTPRDFPFQLRQRPGPQNALGQVKLMFPNPHNVYLHDTPSRELFGRTRRDFSSGCVRVDRALELTAWTLSGTPGWDRERIDAAVTSGREVRVDLAAKVPVHIMYMTAVRAAAGTIRFVSDLYDRDPRLIAALNKRWPG